jgi:hypothetical protein
VDPDTFNVHGQVVGLIGPDEVLAISFSDLLDDVKKALGASDISFPTCQDINQERGGSLSQKPPEQECLPMSSLNDRPIVVAEPLTLSSPRLIKGSFEDDQNRHLIARPRRVAMEAFHNEVLRLTKSNYQGQPFVLIRQLESWMESIGDDCDRPGSSWLVLLFIDAYQDHGGIEKYASLMTLKDNFQLSSTKSYFRLFCVLLQIWMGHLIETLSFFISDDDLPIRPEDLEMNIKTRNILKTKDIEQFVQQFITWQYFFCCRSLEKRYITKFSSKDIVPISRLQKLSDEGLAAKIFRIEVPEDYVSPNLQEAARHMNYERDGNTVSQVT